MGSGSLAPVAGVTRNVSGVQAWSVLDRVPVASSSVLSSPVQNVSHAAFYNSVSLFYFNILLQTCEL